MRASHITPERIALFMCAAGCQGGHSAAGATAAEVLGIPFPVTMENLAKQAMKEGLNPRELWGWWKNAPTPTTT